MKQVKIDFGKLLLRIGVGGLMIFHGINKLLHGHDGIKATLANHNWPEWLWIGVPIGEVLAPLLVILGIFTRISALLIAVTMIVSMILAFGMSTFHIGPYGGLKAELNLLFTFSALAITFIGSGRYAIYKKEKGILS